MPESRETDASAMADAVLGDDDPPFRPPVAPASEPAETSAARQSEAVQAPSRPDDPEADRT